MIAVKKESKKNTKSLSSALADNGKPNIIIDTQSLVENFAAKTSANKKLVTRIKGLEKFDDNV